MVSLSIGFASVNCHEEDDVDYRESAMSDALCLSLSVSPQNRRGPGRDWLPRGVTTLIQLSAEIIT
ncbi:hypothetical protein ACFSFZ_20500 [Mixta tenebrionis]|uniref:Uncharacterized protein n=1 Tax=Mixta tenebrionis TaxID=2562439 RepID=A0A506V6M2_9GAMM|nr:MULTISPECIES: hypothetical protein [Mixta]TPW41062.1 hypothetical protein FKM52_16350 [Mixta tenebrionis]